MLCRGTAELWWQDRSERGHFTDTLLNQTDPEGPQYFTRRSDFPWNETETKSRWPSEITCDPTVATIRSTLRALRTHPVQQPDCSGITIPATLRVESQIYADSGSRLYQGLRPSNPMAQALAYARTRRAAPEVFLTDPDVAVDTNHLERAPCRRYPWVANWLFAWTELGATHVGIVQSLLVTCRLHDIDPYIYLLDVLQRVGDHPASRVAELTPRPWKQHFAANPLRSVLRTLTR